MQYFMLTIKHKWFVFLAGLKTRAPLWRLIIHDWCKFMPSELPHYQRQFFGKADDPLGFAKCWLHHQNSCPHHWEYWISRSGHNHLDPSMVANGCLPMPEWAVREMVADWLGAGRAYEGKWPDAKDWWWFKKNRDRIFENMHPYTIATVEMVIRELRHPTGRRDGTAG